MSNFLVTIAVFLITIIGALFAVPYFVDWNGYRSVFEEEASRLLGREVRVGGAVNLHLLPTPYFRFEKVRIADTSVNLQEPFFRTESVTVKLSVPPLLRGAVEANEIEFRRPILRLALDDKDGWNWQSFGQSLGNAAYFPTNVVLTSLKITDGVLALHGPNGLERSRLEGLNADLSSPSLEGPYRLRGTYGKAGAERELRIATAKPESDGSVRFKGTLRLPDTGFNYALDARVIDLMGKPRVDGELTARLPFAGIWRDTRSAASATAAQDEAFDFKAAVKADAGGATLSDLSLSFEQDGKPQLITGDLKADWRADLKIETALASRWLDLDRIAGAGQNAAPLDSIIPFAMRIRDLLPAESRSRASFTADQANLGREAVSGLRFAMVRTGDRLDIEEARAGMPGGSRGELQGSITGTPDASVFTGSLALRGTSVVRFVNWAVGDLLPADAKGDGPFGLRANLRIDDGRAVVRDLVGDLSGTTLQGAASYRWQGRPELSLQLEGPQLDARAFVPAGAKLGDVLDLVLHGPAAPQTAAKPLGPGKTTGWRTAQTDTLIEVSAGQLLTAGRTYRDVAIQLELKGGNLRVPLLKMTGDDGFSLELEGEVTDAATKPKGSVRALVSAETPQSLAPLSELVGVPDTLRLSDRRLQALAPLRLAGTMAFGARTANSVDLTLDGEANGGKVKATSRFDGGTGGWRTGRAEVTASIENTDGTKIAALIAPDTGVGREGNRPGRVLITAGGIPSEGLSSIAYVEAGDVALGFRGRIAAGEGGNTATGDLELKGADAGRLAALAGLAPPLRLEGVPISGNLKLVAGANAVSLERLALKVGGTDIKGQIALSPAGERRHVEARLDFEQLTLAGVLGTMLDQRLATAAAESVVSGRDSVWPDEPFDPAVLNGFEGNVTIAARRIAIVQGVTLGETRLEVVLGGGKAEVKKIDAAALGGRLDGTLTIERAASGAEVRGTLRLGEASLEAFAVPDGGAAAGKFNATVVFSGRGSSPRSAVAALQGSGNLDFSGARLPALWPGAIAAAAAAGLASDGDKLGPALRQAFTTRLSGGQLPLPETIKLVFADGQLRAEPITIDTPEGRASGTAGLDLAALGFSSEWRIEGKPRAEGEKPLPAVTVLYRGPVAALGSLQPRIVTDALEREIAVRKMEKDVEELERLRRLDEARRRSDTERLRQQLERTAPPPPPVPVMPPSGAGARPATPG